MLKNIINTLLQNSGKLPQGMSWYELGITNGIESPDKERAEKSSKYKRKSIGRKTQKIWQKYLKEQKKLKLTKQVYHDGELKFETFQDRPEDVKMDFSDFEIDKLTTNPYGGAWLKMRKKDGLHSEEHFEKLKEILTKSITPISYQPNKIYSEKAIFIYGSDKHIGALTKQDSIYKNKYNKEVIKQRLINETLNQIDEWISYFGFCESLYIMDFGDALDGFNQKTTGGLRGTSHHTLPQQLNNREQLDFYVEVHKELFDIIVERQYAKNIFFIATSNSNHGGDFEYGAMRHLETYLNIKYPFIQTSINYYPFNHFFYGHHCIIFGHGKDEEDMKSGLPLNINPKVENFLNDYIDTNGLGEFNITVVTGDLHQSSENYGKKLRYKKVLSQYGSSKWMHTNFGSGSPGLSSELFMKNSSKIFKTDTFFEIDNESNTGIIF